MAVINKNKSYWILDTRLLWAHYVLSTEAIRQDVITPADLNENKRTMGEQRHFWNNQPPLAAFPDEDAPHIKEDHVHQAMDANSFNGAAQRLANFYRSEGIPVVFNVAGETWHFDVLDQHEDDLIRAAERILERWDREVIKPGERQRQVKFIKHQLHFVHDPDTKEPYFLPGGTRPGDGWGTEYNDKLVGAVKKFQRDHDLKPDGIIGPATNRKIDRAYEAAQERRKKKSAKQKAEERKKKFLAPPSETRLMRVSDEFIAFLASWEGEELEAYQVKGENFFTIGVGHAREIDGKLIRKGQKITRAKSRELLQEDLLRFEAAVRELVPLAWRKERRFFEVCVSMAFNMGEEILTTDPPLESFAQALRRPVNAANISHASETIKLYNKGGTPLRVMDGLVRRRKAEAHLFKTGKYILNK